MNGDASRSEQAAARDDGFGLVYDASGAWTCLALFSLIFGNATAR